MNGLLKRVTLVCLCILAFGCDDADNAQVNTPDDIPNEGCTPDPNAWEDLKPTVETYCGLCHGETPAFGAPYGLLDYETLVMGAEGERPIDRLVARMRTGDMPPVGQPAVPASEAIALMDWATCGDNMDAPPPGPTPGGFDVTRPVFAPETTAPMDANIVEFRADNGQIPEDVSDLYSCFSFKGPSGGERYIRRIEAVIDDTRVLHHIVVYEVPEGAGDGKATECATNLSTAIYAWAPGQQALQFLEGGLITDDSRRYVLEIHYNNAAGYDDVSDQSGIRIYHTAPEGPAIDMLTIGPDGFLLPARSRTEVQGVCTVEEPLTVVASAPHMHELGLSLSSTITRADGNSEDLITLIGWDFDTQLFYDTSGLQLRPGDTIQTNCVFENTSGQDRRFGAFTDDEMCFNFLFVTPPPAERRCNDNIEDTVSYEPGECAPDNAAEIAIPVEANAQDGGVPTAMGGAFPRGDWRLVDYTLVFDSADIGIGVLDLDETKITSSGALRVTEDGRLEMDVAGEINTMFTNGGAAAQPVGLSIAGTISEDNPETGALRVALECPQEGNFSTTYTYADGKLTFYLPFNRVTTGVAVPVFERVE